MARIALVCISPLRHDSRVLRHAALLAEAGHDVRVLAQAPLPEALPSPVAVVPGPGSNTRVRLGMVMRQAPASLFPGSSQHLYWLSYSRLVARRKLLAFRPDLVIANDWRALPIAFTARRSGARIVYDSHEFASEEFSDSWRWRMLARRHVAAIEERFIGRADAVVTVSAGLADALAQRYGLPTPTVVSNVPAWQPTAFRPAGDLITVLYHGVVVPRRGLEDLIASVPMWPHQFRLVIRGPAQGGFDQHLRQLAGPLGDRVSFEAGVPPDEVVAAAAQADIGIFLLANSTMHARYAMPNKIFEYMQAGLMIVSSDLPEVRRVIDAAGCGALLDHDSPECIARTLSGIDRTQIDACKRAALARAQNLNFGVEGVKLLAVVARALAKSA